MRDLAIAYVNNRQMDKWDACAFVVNEAVLEGRICYSELDLSSITDITDFVLVFSPLDEDDKYTVLPYFWVPEDTLERLYMTFGQTRLYTDNGRKCHPLWVH